MKSDLDQLMAARKLEAVLVVCDEYFSAPRAYLTNGAELGSGFVVKARGVEPFIVANPMEVEEAARSGLKVYSQNDLGWADLLEAAEGDRSKADLAFVGRVLETAQVVSGKVGVYGVGDFNVILERVRRWQSAYPQYEFAGEAGMTLFDEAFTTKDADELARLRSVAERTNTVLQRTWDYIRAGQVQGERVVNAETGEPMTIGDVRRFVRKALLDVDLEDTHMIFAQGRDGGFPHSRGEDGEALRLGEAIVFDLFPREVGGGYFHDVTRTWSLGYARPEVAAAYQEVMEAFDVAVEVLRPGMPTRQVQEAVQDYFEGKGHATTRSHPSTTEGYTHSLGHGVGLNIHERPSIGHLSKDTFRPGNVITIEPGLYYPERGFGVRVEDTMYLDEDGQLVSLSTFRKDLVIPMGTP